MLLTIARSALSDLMNRGAVAAARNAIVPIMSHVLLRAEGNLLRATSSDLTMESSAVAMAEIVEPGAVTVEASALKQFADRLPAAATVKIAIDGDKLVASAGRMRARFSMLPASDFPVLDLMKGEPAVFSLTADDLATLFGRTIAAVERGGSRYYLDGVYLHKVAHRLNAVATNGHALLSTSIVAADVPEFGKRHGNGAFGVIVPTEAVAVALRLFGREAVTVAISEFGIEIAGAAGSIVSKVVDGTFPDCDRIMPALTDNRVTLDRASTLTALGVIEVFQARDGGSLIECAEDTDGLAMAAGADANGDGFAVAEAEFSGQLPTFGVSSKYLRMALGAFTAEHVTVSLADPGSPLRFFVENDDSVVGVVMPMRVRTGLVGQGARS